MSRTSFIALIAAAALALTACAGPNPSGARNASTIAGLSTNWPSGLFQSLAILARNLLGAMPAEAVSRVSSRIASRMFVAIAVALPRSCFGAVTSS